MNSKDIIQENNRKREELNEQNVVYYEDMLTYIRINSNKSEQQTEEILLELLDHLLIAQSNGDTAKDIFGNDLKAYCDEIIGELPEENKKTGMLFFLYIGLIFIAASFITHAVINYGFALFDIGETEFTFSLGKALVLSLILAITLFVMFKFIFKMISSSLFKKQKQSTIRLFITSFIIGALIGTPLVVSFFFMPSFGKEITIPLYFILLIGIVSYLVTLFLNKKYRITK